LRTYRFHVDQDQLRGGEVRIVGPDARQIRTVLRLGIGDELQVTAGGCHYRAQIAAMTRGLVTAEILEAFDLRTEPSVTITLAQALSKGEKLDWIVQKGTELGVSEFALFHSCRCIAKLDAERTASRIARLHRITKEAAEQSGRCIVPKVRGVLSFDELLREVSEYDLALLCSEGEGTPMLGNALCEFADVGNILVIVGPEGGLSEDEEAGAVRAGAKPVSLGSRILRCETAALAASAIIVHETDRRAVGKSEAERSA